MLEHHFKYLFLALVYSIHKIIYLYGFVKFGNLSVVVTSEEWPHTLLYHLFTQCEGRILHNAHQAVVGNNLN